MKRKISLRNLRKKAEAVFHRWIIKRDNGICFTCGKPGNQASHFCHSRLDFEPLNLHCGCIRCNHFLRGNLGVYAVELDKRYGQGSAERMILESHTTSNKFDRQFLEDILKKYAE